MNTSHPFTHTGCLLLLALAAGHAAAAGVPSGPLSLARAEQLATQAEPGHASQLAMAEALRKQAVAEGELPDPMLMFGVMNVPTDSFALDEDPMSQLKVSVRQQIPRGDSRSIRMDKMREAADAMAAMADARLLMVRKMTRVAWLDAWYWETARRIVARDKPLIEQLRQVTSSYYRVGRKQLQDVIRSELELQRLDDRLVVIDENIEKSRAALSRWVGDEAAEWPLDEALPDWKDEPKTAEEGSGPEVLLSHPMIRSLDRQIDERKKEVELAEQNYKPMWSVELGYANRRAPRPNGTNAPDLLSAAVSVDLPIFRGKRQDMKLASAEERYQSVIDARLEKVRDLASQLEKSRARLARIEERKKLHESLILPQTAQQVEASLQAYEANTSDFAEVMRAHIADLDARLRYQQIKVNRLKAIADLRFLIPPPDETAADNDNTESSDS